MATGARNLKQCKESNFTGSELTRNSEEFSLSNKRHALRASTKTASSRWVTELFKAVTGSLRQPSQILSPPPPQNIFSFRTASVKQGQGEETWNHSW